MLQNKTIATPKIKNNINTSMALKDLTLCLDTEHLMHTKLNTSVNTQIQNKLKRDNSSSNKRIISLLYLKSSCFDICVTFETFYIK